MASIVSSQSYSTTSGKQVAIWLFAGCILIFVMVLVGGITRLTGSGLSITEWKPIMGIIPPLNEHDWQVAFEKYKEIPQFQKINFDFTIDDFKSIFWWEFIHRLIGRLIGIVFIIPFLWFYFTGRLDKTTTRRALFLFLLGALQGFIGWFMVKSGLSERTSVSHIRLAIHLITAFITFGFTFYFALEVLRGNKFFPAEQSVKKIIRIIFPLIILQIIYGAFVAGLHAGKIYNTFPLMNGELIPPGLSFMTPAWENFFDNNVAVQFIHRILAFTIFILGLILLVKTIRNKNNSSLKIASLFFFIVLSFQVLLGILTLLTSVNIILAICHQAAAFLLFASGVYLMFLTRRKMV